MPELRGLLTFGLAAFVLVTHLTRFAVDVGRTRTASGTTRARLLARPPPVTWLRACTSVARISVRQSRL